MERHRRAPRSFNSRVDAKARCFRLSSIFFTDDVLYNLWFFTSRIQSKKQWYFVPVWKSKFYGAFVPNRHVVFHAIDATPARWRGDAGSSPFVGAGPAASDVYKRQC